MPVTLRTLFLLPFASHPIAADAALGDVALLGVADVGSCQRRIK